MEYRGSPLSIYQVLEVSFSETEGQFMATTSSRLVTSLDFIAVECLQFVDNAVLFFDEDEKITVFWDTARDKYASWKHEGNLPVLGVSLAMCWVDVLADSAHFLCLDFRR
jgi:hypothetical protein